MTQPIVIDLYKWAGKWGPFKVNIPCGECALTTDIIKDTLANELKGIPVEIKTHEWLSVWWKPLKTGAWHAPIVIVQGKLVSQGEALNRGVLTQAVIEAHVGQEKIQGNHVFGKESCPHCKRAKKYLDDRSVPYEYHDVVLQPQALYRMLGLVKPIVGPKTPVTVPQIWIEGSYVGGADQLSQILDSPVDPNPDRGQCSLSPAR